MKQSFTNEVELVEAIEELKQMLNEAAHSPYQAIMFNKEDEVVTAVRDRNNGTWEVFGEVTPYTNFESISEASMFIANIRGIDVHDNFIPDGLEDIQLMEDEYGWTL